LDVIALDEFEIAFALELESPRWPGTAIVVEIAGHRRSLSLARHGSSLCMNAPAAFPQFESRVLRTVQEDAARQLNCASVRVCNDLLGNFGLSCLPQQDTPVSGSHGPRPPCGRD
jgi:hypothetical protein